MSKLQTKIKRMNKKCRGVQNHYSVHSPKHDIEFCKKCDAYVEITDLVVGDQIKKDRCRCCGSKTEKMQKKTWLTRVLKTGIRQHHNFIRDWCLYPEGCFREKIKPRWDIDEDGKRVKIHRDGFTKKPDTSQYVEIKYKGIVYEIQIRYLALYLEPINEEEKLKIIGKKLSIKGYRIWYDKEEEMDEKCVMCNRNLKFDNEGHIFCPECTGKK